MAATPRVEIAPGVFMPLLNFGVQQNHSLAIALGARGLDTANIYGDAQQRDVGAAVRTSALPRSELFVTTKIECCPGAQFLGSAAPVCRAAGDPRAAIAHDFAVLGLAYVDLLLLHWPRARSASPTSTRRCSPPSSPSSASRR
ncbi:hypothetical protein AB1Y20_007674 [Prymnesium parvum]|uniref:NADP-dependent oxidoreductase domain-containing protein n=1 Tax=Prymnesium parvum TaxID=97485 RepID=A0AB34IW59_PRYPA